MSYSREIDGGQLTSGPPHLIPEMFVSLNPLAKNPLLAPYRGNNCEVLFSSLEVNGKNYSIVFPNVHGRL